MNARAQTVWTDCLAQISSRVPAYSYETWIRPIRALSLDGHEKQILNLEVPNAFHQRWIEEHFREVMDDSVRLVLGPNARPAYTIGGSRFEEAEPPAERHYTREPLPAGDGMPMSIREPEPAPAPASARPSASGSVQDDNIAPPQLNEHYTFDEFVECDGNRLARNAALAIAHRPGSTSFNPLFIYGNVGLGKTHLAQAICHQAMRVHPDLRVVYVSSDNFTNQFIAAIRNNRSHDFANFYRGLNVLVVDDIQFLSGKERTQEEFFHLFNVLHQSGGQIVLCADRPPRDIQGIHARLVSRFQWGLTADISAPDFETRAAILLQKSRRYNLDLPPEVIDTIARSVSTNIRDLEGILTKLLAHSLLHQTEIDERLVCEVLGERGTPMTRITLERIMDVVSEEFGILREHIVGKSRKREVVLARQTVMHFAKLLTHQSLKSIGAYFAGRDHSTVIHALRTIEGYMDTDPQFNARVDRIERLLKRQGH
ncbi:MAG: chromosomal replication initiator protein DnaA [Rhodothermales bacterium]|nr:chromosomal replication initiator protein DnaA [Rhodothermales bacterium]